MQSSLKALTQSHGTIARRSSRATVGIPGFQNTSNAIAKQREHLSGTEATGSGWLYGSRQNAFTRLGRLPTAKRLSTINRDEAILCMAQLVSDDFGGILLL